MSRPPRVYSSALVVTEQPNDGYAAVYVVPAGHRWVLKSLTWCDTLSNDWELLTYTVMAEAEFANSDGGVLSTCCIQDSKLKGQRPGEWMGRITIDAGEKLILANYTTPFDGRHPITISVHGYDFMT